MDMLFDGMFVPKEQPDGSLLWRNLSNAKTFTEIAETFTKITGKKAAHQYVPFEEYAKMA
ncbi:hypothetical protein CH63R_14347 [Colletotrichum higginsianum IMI 349063]|uniref:Uncharacterized protein n=2 Tax=Colletotrichum higginsianum TaxID=80884 RepID=A0A1B7XTN4_COLHI|nr:hypothetical protein CH63R_14347 [Colletotrichum higginsianum IMI 349063]OBR03121.1 hypothetical protein CH63R_14347 [Colletotrichum higginsianum IMI 349063]GJD05127.1 hypothetical protein ColKHC_13952 [Colletotrichum higginsianum]